MPFPRIRALHGDLVMVDPRAGTSCLDTALFAPFHSPGDARLTGTDTIAGVLVLTALDDELAAAA